MSRPLPAYLYDTTVGVNGFSHHTFMSDKPTPEEAASFEWGGTRARPRKKIEKVMKKGATYLKPPGSCNSKWKDVSVAINIECCEESTIAILDTTSQVQISDCVNCRIIVGPCTGSVFLLECTNCTISIAAKQLRLRDCFNCTFRTYAPTSESVVIETCKDLKFGAWEVCYSGLAAQFAGIPDWDPKKNFWNKIYDFSPPAEPSAPKNYSLLPVNYGLLEEQGFARWSELTFSAEGLCDGKVSQTKGAVGTVAGCECPCQSADGMAYVLHPSKAEGSAAGAPAASSDGVSGYSRMYAKPAGDGAANAKSAGDGVAGYGRMLGGGASSFDPPPGRPAPAAEKTTAADATSGIELTIKKKEEEEDPGLLRRVISWIGSWFGL